MAPFKQGKESHGSEAIGKKTKTEIISTFKIQMKKQREQNTSSINQCDGFPACVEMNPVALL